MIVRCGACRNQFDVPGEGRFACPVCGSVNMVRGRAGTGPGGAPPPGSMPPTGAPPGDYGTQPPPPPPPEQPSPKIQCPECGFSFIVGDIAVAVCPMCSAEVPTGRATPEEND